MPISALALAAQVTATPAAFPATSSSRGSPSAAVSPRWPSSSGVRDRPRSHYVPQWRPASLQRRIGQPRGADRCHARSDLAIFAACSLGEEVAFGAGSSRLRNRSVPPTPCICSAAGPRMIESGGARWLDGAFLMVGLHPRWARAARRHLEAGAARAGRSLAGFPVAYVVTLGLGPMTTSARAG